jgi:hypothetical protein
MKKSDVLDRWTILLMKAQKDPRAKAELEQYDQEVRSMLATAGIRVLSPFDLTRTIVLLMEANAKIWAKESALRAGSSSDGSDTGMTFQEIGVTALEIRELNKLRVGAKQAIDEMYGELPDVKVEHASQ